MADEADMQKFLSENKIDPAALMAGAKQSKQEILRNKTLATLEARMNAYPYTAEDIYQLRTANLASFAKHAI